MQSDLIGCNHENMFKKVKFMRKVMKKAPPILLSTRDFQALATVQVHINSMTGHVHLSHSLYLNVKVDLAK